MLGYPEPGKGRDKYYVIVSGKGDIERFITQVGTLSQKKLVHQVAIVDYMTGRIAKTNRDVLPKEAWNLFAIPAMEVIGMTPDAMVKGLGHKRFNPVLYKQNLSRERASRLAQIVQCARLTSLAQSDV